MSGSVRLIRSLLAVGLLDELHLLVHPLVVGEGMRLFPEGSESFPLPVASATAPANGTVHVVRTPPTRRAAEGWARRRGGAGLWTVEAGTVIVTPLRRFSRADRAAVTEEGREVAAFLSEGEHHRVRVAASWLRPATRSAGRPRRCRPGR